MFTKRIGLSFVVFILILFLPGFIVEAEGQGCSVATLNGSFGDLEQGTVLGDPGLPLPEGVTLPPTPFPAVLSGIVTFDGSGHVSATFTASFGGLTLPGFASGTYEVSPDCIYSDTITPAENVYFHHAGTVTGQGMLQELNFTYTDAWLVVTGTEKKMPSGPCSLATLKGSFGDLEQGFVFGLPASLSATAIYDGAGNLSGMATLNNNGGAVTAPYTATYTVNPDCTYTDTISFGGETSTRAGTITGEGTNQEVHTIYTDPGIVGPGTLKKQ